MISDQKMFIKKILNNIVKRFQTMFRISDENIVSSKESFTFEIKKKYGKFLCFYVVAESYEKHFTYSCDFGSRKL